MSAKILKVKPSTLSGQVNISGAKNSALRLLAASILTEEDIFIKNFPNNLSDIIIHNKMLEILGKKLVSIGSSIKITEPKGIKSDLLWEGRSIRNTLLIMGALLARKGKAIVPLPGGCKIGVRKYDLHEMILRKLGAEVWEEKKYLCAEAPNGLFGTDIFLPIRSTGATENAIITSSLAKGKCIIWNPHIRPEILDLISMLKKMGAKIEVRGNESISVEGVERLQGVEHRVIPDNMEALTYLIGTVITNGEVEIKNFPVKHLEVPLIFLKASGTKIYYGENSVIVKGGKCYPVEICTGPYPGINSDMQPLFAIYGLCSRGTSKIVDLRFSDRFGYALELTKMNAKFEKINNMLVVKGGNLLNGTNVKATDLRSGAALLLAGLVASSETVVYNAEQIERGYENFKEKFLNLGAEITWIK